MHHFVQYPKGEGRKGKVAVTQGFGEVSEGKTAVTQGFGEGSERKVAVTESFGEGSGEEGAVLFALAVATELQSFPLSVAPRQATAAGITDGGSRSRQTHQMLDLVLVDPTIRDVCLLAVGRRLQFALRARGLELSETCW